MAKKAEVIITCDATTVKRVLEGLNREMDKTNQRRQQLQQKQAQGSRLNKAEEKELRELIKYENALAERQQKVTREAKKMGEVMRDLASAKLKDLKKALREGKQALDNMSANSAGRAKLVDDLKRIQNQIEKNTGALSKNKDMWGALGTTIKNLFAYAGIFAGFNMLKAKMTEAYEGNKRFSDSMANVRKVSGLAMEDIKKLADNLKGVDSRTGLGGLMELSYTGAKLGFGNYGIGGLESFAKSAVKVQNALAEDMGEDSMTALSKMVEVMGLIPKMGVERAMDATGSAIFKLASTSTATGTNIVEFSKRLMGLANIAHISTADLLAFGSAADSMALMPEVAATAFNKLITSVQKQPNLIENALKIPKGTISDLYQSGKMTEALVTIFERMREKGGMNALMQSGVFKDLGSDGARLVAVMATMANRVDMLQQHLATSRVAFEEGTAVAQEYAIQMDTAAAYSERAANVWEKAFVNPEGVDNVKEFTKAWYQTSVAMTTNEKIMGQIKFTLAGILTLLKGIVYILPSLFMGGAMWGITRMLISLGNALKIATVATTGFAAAWKGMSLITKTNWIGLVATAVFVLIEALGEFNKEVQMSSSYMKGFKKDLSDVNAEQYKAVRQLDGYRKAIDEAKEGTKQRQAAITNFNSKFGPYLSKLLTEKATAYDVAQAYQEVVKQMKAKIALQAKEKDIEKYVSPRVGWEADKLQTYNNSVKGTPGERYNSTWLKGVVDDAHAAGKSVRQVADSIAGYMGLSKGQVDKIWKLRGYGPGNVPSGGMGDYIRNNPKSMQAQLLNAINYTLQSYATSNAQKAVDDKYKPYEQAWNNQITQETYEPLQDKPDKTTGGGGSGKDDRKQALRKEMQDAQKSSEGVIAKIEEWYRLQEAAINNARADGNLTEDQAKEMVRSLNIIKNDTLATARRAVTSGNTEAWDEMKKTVLPTVMSDASQLSANLLKEIQGVSVQSLHNSLKKFNGGLSVYGLNSGAFFDQMNAKAAGNTRESARLKARIINEIDKALKQYQFVEKANDMLRADLEKIGITTETYEQFAERMRKGINVQPDIELAGGGKISSSEAYRRMGTAFVKRGAANYRYNMRSEQDAARWLQDFTKSESGGLEQWAQAFPEIVKWIDIIKKKESGETLGEAEVNALKDAMPQIRMLYKDMMTHSNRIDEAMKKAYDQEKADQSARFRAEGFTDKEKGIDEYLSNRAAQQETGITATFWQQQGLGSIATDPEILQIQNRIYWRNLEVKDAKTRLKAMKAIQDEEIAKLRESHATKEEILALEDQHRQERAGLDQLLLDRQRALTEQTTLLTTTTMQETKKRVQVVQNLVKPFSDAAGNIGKKFGEMIAGAEEQSMTWDEIWKNMALAVAESMLTMMGQYAANAIAKASMNKAEEAEEASHATVMATMGISEGASKTIGTLGWWGIALIPVITALLMGLLQGALSSRSNSSSGASNTSKKAKLVSGMLTYDEGNVGSYVGTDGKIYRATATSAPDTGLVTQPIATTVQGNPALVAEKGPEIVIGRLATRRIMMDEPGLIRHLAQYDKNHAPMPYRTFDGGNVGDYENANGNGNWNANGNANDNARLTAALEQNTVMMQAMMQQLKKPVHINMYGSDGLHTQLKQADKVMSRYDR